MRIAPHAPLRALALAALASVAALPVRAETLLTQGHVDLGANYEGGAWGFEVHDGETDTEYDPADAVLVAPLAARMARPGSSSFDFLGVAPGEDVWILPQSEDPGLLFLGIASEHTDPRDFGAWNPGDSRIPAGSFKWLEWQLVGVDSPAGAHFSLFSVDSFGQPLLWMSTFANPNPNSFFQLVGGHSHANFAFTHAGDYDITFRVRGMLADGTMTESGDGTFRFRVLGDTQVVVPESSSITMATLGLGLVAGLGWRRRRARA
jgi:surface-anchored protein